MDDLIISKIIDIRWMDETTLIVCSYVSKIFRKYANVFIEQLINAYNYEHKYDVISTYECCRDRKVIGLRLLLEKSDRRPDFNRGLIGACEGGHLDLARLMIRLGANGQWDQTSYESRRDSTKFYIEFNLYKSNNTNYYWNLGLYHACKNKHYEICTLMINKGATHCLNCKSTRLNKHHTVKPKTKTKWIPLRVYDN